MKRTFALTDVSGAERVAPSDDWDVIAPGLRIRYDGRVWTVVAVNPRSNRVVLED